MSILKLPDIVYPLSHVNKTNEIIDVLNDNLNMYYSEENPTLTSSEGACTWTVTHNLGTENINYSIYEGSNSIIADVSITSENAITITFNSSSNIAAKTYSIVVISNGAGSSTGGGSITVDSELSPISENPVKNFGIYNAIYYKSGEKFNYVGYYRIACFYNASAVCFSIILDKRKNGTLSASITKFRGAIVDNNGNTYAGTTLTSPQNLLDKGTCQVVAFSNNLLSINYTITSSSEKPSGWKALYIDVWELEITFS